MKNATKKMDAQSHEHKRSQIPSVLLARKPGKMRLFVFQLLRTRFHFLFCARLRSVHRAPLENTLVFWALFVIFHIALATKHKQTKKPDKSPPQTFWFRPLMFRILHTDARPLPRVLVSFDSMQGSLSLGTKVACSGMGIPLPQALEPSFQCSGWVWMKSVACRARRTS